MMKAQVTFHTGHILIAGTFENQYQVVTDEGTILATSLESGSGRRGGHIGGGGYMPGAQVLIACMVRTEEQTSRPIGPNLILGAYNPYPTFEGTEFEPNANGRDSNAGAVKNEAYRRIQENEQTTNLTNENRGANRPLDVLPGDWFKSTVLGGCLFISEFMSKIGSSPDCSISFSGIDKLAEIVSHNFSADHGSELREIIHRGMTPIDVSSFALTLSEGLGGAPPLIDAEDAEDPNKIIARSAIQTGYFRRDLFQGGVEGYWDVFRYDDKDRDLHTFGEHIYPGMLSDMQRVDGVFRIRAAKEIRFEKTYGIVSPWKERDLRGAPPSDELPLDNRVDIQFKQQELGLESEDEVSALRPLLHDKFANIEEEKLFFRGLKRDGDVWYFPTVDEVKKQVFDDVDPTVRVLGNQEQEYTLADIISKDIDVYPGRRIRLFKNSSVFLMAEDGGLILGDGYGGELRFNRGALTLAAVGDIRVLPGRDLVEQVPGNRISRVGERVEVSSTNNAIVHKAHTNYQICSGGTDGGALVLENRSPLTDMSEIEKKTLLQGKPFGAGIILKSTQAGTSILGSYLYGSAYAKGVESTSGVDEQATSCDILLNSGNGTLGLRGSNAVMSFRNSVALTMMEQATGLYLTQGSMMALAREEITAVTQGFVVDKGVGEVMRPLLKAARVDISQKAKLPSRAPVLEVNGSIRAKEEIATKGDVLSEKSVRSNSGANFEPITSAAERITVPLTTADSTRAGNFRSIAFTAANLSKGLLERMITEGVATERGQKITELAFPDSESDAYRATNYELVAPRWQEILSGTASTWIEREVAHAILKKTYPYPGRTVYEKGNPLITSSGSDIIRKPLNEYKKNC
jgi:hypothetical protein